jgi:hypothetical protein
MEKNSAGSAKKNKNADQNNEQSKGEQMGKIDVSQFEVTEAPVSIMEIHEYLSGIEYPAEKDELIEYAESQGAPIDVLDALSDISDKHYGVPADISEELSNYR